MSQLGSEPLPATGRTQAAALNGAQPVLCFCNTSTMWGGGEKWHLEAAQAMARRGYRVILVCQAHSALHERVQEHPELELFPVRLGRFSFLNPVLMGSLTSFLRHNRVHAVVLNLPSDLKCLAPAAKKAGVPRIFYRRGSAIPVKNSWMNRRLFAMLTGVIVNSQATRDTLLQNNASFMAPERIHLLPNGVDIATFDAALAAASAGRMGQETPVGQAPAGQAPHPQVVPALPQISAEQAKAPAHSPRPLIIGTAGRLSPQKAQHLFLLLGAALLPLGVPFRLVVAGGGPRQEELHTLATRYGVQEHVEFLGFQENLAPFWQRIDLFVLTSLWEGFGYVLVEAMLARKPVFAFGVSNIPDLVQEGVNGRLFPLPPGAESLNEAAPLREMAEAARQLWQHLEQGTAMGDAGRAFAVAHFSQEGAMDKLEALLR